LNAQHYELKEAIEDFKQNDFKKALTTYQKLLDKYPKDPSYQLYKAACLIALDSNFSEAGQLLQFASIKGLDEEANYYWGECYAHQYEFNEAIQWYNKSNKRKYPDIDFKISQCKYAREILLRGTDSISVLSKICNVPNIYTYHFDSLKHTPAPVNFDSLLRANHLEGENPHPLWLETTPVFYFSATHDAQNNFEVYNYKPGDTKVSKLISKINSEYDELSPNIVANKKLYFSSNRANTLGGFDVFISSYDDTKKSWSEPENLGFPINSTANEFILAVDPDGTHAWLATDRYTYGEYCILHISLNNTLKKKSKFPDYISMSKLQPLNKIRINPENTDSTNHTTKNYSGGLYHPVNTTLHDALLIQAKADSIVRIIENLRQQSDTTPSGNKKELLLKDISRLKRSATSLQSKADELFAELLQTDLSNAADLPLADIDPGEHTDTLAPAPNNTKTDSIVHKSDSVKVIGLRKRQNTFAIVNKTPYSAANPFPVDSLFPSGLLYRIQLGTFSKPVAYDKFKGLYPIYGEKFNTSIRFYVGNFFDFLHADAALQQVRNYGYKEAYIVAFYNGTRLSLEKAKQLEK